MSYRGRLIWPMQARIERLDTASTQATAVAGQPAGYDRIFREPVKVSPGVDARQYMPAIAVACQVKTEGGAYRRAEQMPGGRELEYDVKIALHYQDLELRGLVGADGTTVFQPSDRLVSIYRTDGVTLIQSFASAPLYCVHVQDRSLGLSGLTRNLVMLYFKDRLEGAR